MKRFSYPYLVVATVLLCVCDLTTLPGQPPPENSATKKLIEWGWDEPDTKFMREQIAHMEELPFDGLVFHINSSKGGQLTWEMWGERRFTLEEFQHAVDDLKATRFQRFTDRFLRVNVTPGRVDWFDDATWATVVNNVGIAAQVAKQSGCKGFMFDVEQYEGQLFDYNQQTHSKQKPFTEYQDQVFRRGREWMHEVNKHFPDVTILLTFGYSKTRTPEGGKDRSESAYGLMADFIDGLLDVCTNETTLVDACEDAYPYKQRSQFTDAYDTIHNKGLLWTSLPDKYQLRVKAGFGLWMDYDWRNNGWSTTDFSKNYFSPSRFSDAVRSALDVSDRYVWIYTEKPRWWSNEELPLHYIEAVRKAR